MILSTTALLALILPGIAQEGPYDKALIAAHNRERAERKLPPLTVEPRLTRAARVHAADMARHNIMSHDGTDKSTPADRVKKVKYPYVLTGENVARGQRSVDDVMTAWMNSPHHRENILGDFTEIGVAVEEGGDGDPYWCAVFGQPVPKFDPDRAESDLADRLNHGRSDAGRTPLKVAPRLARAAREIALDLAAERTASVLDPSKPAPKPPDPFERIKQSGYLYQTIAQSGATGTPSPELTLKTLFDDPAEKAMLLKDAYTEIGIGYALAEDGRPSWCLILAKPKGKAFR